MTNQLWDSGREGFLDGSIDWDTDDIRTIFLKSTYTFDTADVYVSDLTPATNDNGRTAALGSKTKAAGVADAGDTSLVATAAVACNAIALYKYNASDALARLIGYIDTATGLPMTPAAGGTVNIVWSDGTNRIFKL